MREGKKRFGAILLAFSLVTGLLAGFGTEAAVSAEGTGTTARNAIMSGEDILGGQKDNVYFGTFWQSEDENGGYQKDPVKWRVLSNDENSDTNTLQLFLLSDQNLDARPYHHTYTSTTWETCSLRAWLNRQKPSEDAEEEEKTAYETEGGFLGDAFGSCEQTAIGTPLADNTGDSVFLLSTTEVWNSAYGFSANQNRIATNTAYAASKLGVSAGDAILYTIKTSLSAPLLT